MEQFFRNFCLPEGSKTLSTQGCSDLVRRECERKSRLRVLQTCFLRPLPCQILPRLRHIGSTWTNNVRVYSNTQIYHLDWELQRSSWNILLWLGRSVRLGHRSLPTKSMLHCSEQTEDRGLWTHKAKHRHLCSSFRMPKTPDRTLYPATILLCLAEFAPQGRKIARMRRHNSCSHSCRKLSKRLPDMIFR